MSLALNSGLLSSVRKPKIAAVYRMAATAARYAQPEIL
jgi:hypothetical protein